MFSKKITDADAFTELPPTTQALYLHLCMGADDDGFVNQIRRAMFNAHADTNDFELLVRKRFIIPFESGVIVIKHWRLHNLIKSDRYHETDYIEEKARLILKENGIYSEVDGPNRIRIGTQVEPKRNPSGTQTEPEDRIGKDSVGKDILSSSDEDDCPSEQSGAVLTSKKTTMESIVSMWNTLTAYGIKPIRAIIPESTRHQLLRARLRQYGDDSFAEVVENIKKSDFLQGKNGNRAFIATFDWVIKPNNYPKVLEGNYDNRQVRSSAPDRYTDRINAVDSWGTQYDSN